MSRWMFELAIALVLLAPAPLLAGAPCTAPSADCVAVGEWDLSVAIGIGERSNPIAGNDDIPLFVIPQLSFYGKRFFLDNLEFGYTLIETESHSLNLIATPGYDRVFFFRNDPQNFFVPGVGLVSAPGEADVSEEMTRVEIAARRARSTTYFTGTEWLFELGRSVGQLSALYEATGRHKGYEVRGAFAVPLVQATASLVLSAGFTWKSSQVVDYYYGIDGYYEPGDAFNPFVKLGFSQPISERCSFTAFVHYERLGSSIADSPLVTEDAVTTAFAGFVWRVF
jgi:outer membrane protein